MWAAAFQDSRPPTDCGWPLATTRLDNDLVQRGLMLAAKPPPAEGEEEEEDEFEERPPLLAEKLCLLFQATYPELADFTVQPVWAAGELLRFNGNFNLFVKGRDLVKQEGIIFRHLLRLILLCGEFAQVCPPDTTLDEWRVGRLVGTVEQVREQAAGWADLGVETATATTTNVTTRPPRRARARGALALQRVPPRFPHARAAADTPRDAPTRAPHPRTGRAHGVAAGPARAR